MNTLRFVVSFSLIFLCCLNSAQAYSPWERDTAFLSGIQLFNNGKTEESVKVFQDLEIEGYGENNPLLYFRFGNALRQLGKLKNEKEYFLSAIEKFKKLKNIYENKKSRVEYKSTVLNLTYTYLNVRDFDVAKTEIENYLNEFPTDGDGLICKAYVFNAIGYDFYTKGDYPDAIINFEKAYRIEKWPFFGSNLINAYMGAADQCKTIKESQTYLKAAQAIYIFHKDKLSWKDPNHNYLIAGAELEKHLKTYHLLK